MTALQIWSRKGLVKVLSVDGTRVEFIVATQVEFITATQLHVHQHGAHLLACLQASVPGSPGDLSGLHRPGGSYACNEGKCWAAGGPPLHMLSPEYHYTSSEQCLNLMGPDVWPLHSTTTELTCNPGLCQLATYMRPCE